jgi:hypothetical protein
LIRGRDRAAGAETPYGPDVTGWCGGAGREPPSPFGAAAWPRACAPRSRLGAAADRAAFGCRPKDAAEATRPSGASPPRPRCGTAYTDDRAIAKIWHGCTTGSG